MTPRDEAPVNPVQFAARFGFEYRAPLPEALVPELIREWNLFVKQSKDVIDGRPDFIQIWNGPAWPWGRWLDLALPWSQWIDLLPLGPLAWIVGLKLDRAFGRWGGKPARQSSIHMNCDWKEIWLTGPQGGTVARLALVPEWRALVNGKLNSITSSEVTSAGLYTDSL